MTLRRGKQTRVGRVQYETTRRPSQCAHARSRISARPGSPYNNVPRKTRKHTEDRKLKTLLLATLIAASSTLHAYDTEYQFGFNASPFNSKGELTPAATDYFLKNHAGATLWCIGKFSQASISCYKRWYGLFINAMAAARFIVHLENDRQGQERQNVALCHTFSSTCSHDIGDAAQFTNDLQVASFPEMMLRMRPNTDFF